MGKVNLLLPQVISKIAAGEVIERPASVVKELIENSFDAETKSIEIHLKQAGKTSINIKDSGTGIEQDDIEKIFLRYSTSKIHNAEDIYRISSLGFRGEALYSIASVSDIILRSRYHSQQTGWEIHLRAGEKLNLRPLNMPQGTEIEIKELFFNTPARKKFLKSDTTELNQILNIFIPYTILYPGLRFILKNYERSLLDLSPEKNRSIRISRVLNLKETDLIETRRELSQEEISLHLILGDINIRRVRKDMQFIFVNNRPVQNRNISFHINQTYRLIFPSEVYPFFAVFIDLPSENVDVNIHPTKREVKIKNEYRLISFLRSICEQTIMTRGKAKQIKEISSTPNISFPEGHWASAPAPVRTVREPQLNQYRFFSENKIIQPEEKNIPSADQSNLKDKLSHSRYLGTFIKKYLLFESDSSILIIDQHAVQERIGYEKLKRQIETGRIEAQHLLSPALIKLSPQEMLIWEEIKDKLQDLGLSTTAWDKETIALHAYPVLISKPETALRNLISQEDPTAYDNDSLIRRACRQSIMAGYETDKKQAEYLKQQLIKCTAPFACPHGRPTVIEIDEKVLNKQFLRG